MLVNAWHLWVLVYLPKTAINEPFLLTDKEKCPENIMTYHRFSWGCIKDKIWKYFLDSIVTMWKTMMNYSCEVSTLTFALFIFITHRFTQYLSSQIKERIYLTSHWWILYLRQGGTYLIRLSQGDPRHTQHADSNLRTLCLPNSWNAICTVFRSLAIQWLE